MITPDKEARDRAHMRDLQVGLPAGARRSELLDAVSRRQALDDILGRSWKRAPCSISLPATARSPAPSWRRASGARGRSIRCSARFSSVASGEVGHALSDPALGSGPLIFLKTPPHAAIDLGCHARPVRSARQALRQAGQCRAQARRRRRRGDRFQPRCAAGQHAGLAVVALGLLLGRAARPRHRHRPSRRAAARSHGEERARALGRAASGARAADGQRQAPAQGSHRGASRLR